MNVAFVATDTYGAAVEVVVTKNVEDRIRKNQVEHQRTRLRNPKINKQNCRLESRVVY